MRKGSAAAVGLLPFAVCRGSLKDRALICSAAAERF